MIRYIFGAYLEQFSLSCPDVNTNKGVAETTPFNMFKCVSALTFLLGECITGAGGEGGPRGIFLFVLADREGLCVANKTQNVFSRTFPGQKICVFFKSQEQNKCILVRCPTLF